MLHESAKEHIYWTKQIMTCAVIGMNASEWRATVADMIEGLPDCEQKTELQAMVKRGASGYSMARIVSSIK